MSITQIANKTNRTHQHTRALTAKTQHVRQVHVHHSYSHVTPDTILLIESTLCLRKVPTFKLSVTLSNLTDFLIFCTARKRMKFATKARRHYPPDLRHFEIRLRFDKVTEFKFRTFLRHGV